MFYLMMILAHLVVRLWFAVVTWSLSYYVMSFTVNFILIVITAIEIRVTVFQFRNLTFIPMNLALQPYFLFLFSWPDWWSFNWIIDDVIVSSSCLCVRQSYRWSGDYQQVSNFCVLVVLIFIWCLFAAHPGRQLLLFFGYDRIHFKSK